MSRQILVSVAGLTEENRETIRTCAGKYGFSVRFFEDNEEAKQQAQDAEVIYGIGAGLIRNAPKLRWFHSSSAGMDFYLKEDIIAREELTLTSSSGAYGVTLAEHTLMTTLEILRRQPHYEEIVRGHGWGGHVSQGTIKNSRVTVLGTGDLGIEVAKRVRAFEPERIVGINRSGVCPHAAFDEIRTQEEANAVLPETDILIMCLPGTRETTHFMDRDRIALLPKHAVLVNVGRGNALDQVALADALNAGDLAAAALDVFEKEPLSPADPIWDTKNLLITPHIAGNLTTAYTRDKNVALFVENLERYATGEALRNVLDPKKGY